MIPERIPVLDPLRSNTAYRYGYYSGMADLLALLIKAYNSPSVGKGFKFSATMHKYRDQATTEMAKIKTQGELL